jgi:palmitoyltransferase ZDHHC9/14/18
MSKKLLEESKSNKEEKEKDNQETIIETNAELYGIDQPKDLSTKFSKDFSKEIPGLPSIYTSRKCTTCNIIKPPKASHCGVCDNCVLNFDQ